MYHFFKRVFDIVLSLIALIILSPIFLIAAILIKISSPGPVFYISKRTKKGHKPFRFFKFRSMHVTKKDKGMFVADPDRLFRVGRVIRKLKIDELPQLLNVFLGDMSIVGPRPMPIETVDKTYHDEYKKVLSIRPGLTSPASLYDYMVGDTYSDNDKYIKEVLPVKNEMELIYVEKENFFYDISIIFRTIVAIFSTLFHCKRKPKQKEVAIAKERLLRKDNGNN